ncbi:MAG TPA: aldehyde dehydrogenase, partial [Acidimicrobiaceae bacterium]|nr:aldehyde dehydrogenase [Acidimicrobiaceae bacterium]
MFSAALAMDTYKTELPSFGFHAAMGNLAAPPSSAPISHDPASSAESVASGLLAASLSGATRRERRRQARLGRMLADPATRELLFGLTDEVLRLRLPREAAARFADLVTATPSLAVGRIDAALLRAGALVATRAPRLVMPMVTRRIKAETHGIVLPADDPGFSDHVRRRRGEGVRLNVNTLGEAILSDAEADERMRKVCARIDRPDVDYVSVKISSIVANLDVFAFDHCMELVCGRLTELYRRANAAMPRTFVNLDMEEYRDLELTLQAFMRVLSQPEFHTMEAGIVVQAYLPDSHDALERLGEWAGARVAAGGGQVKVRLVKGANLAMEKVEAELHGWTPAPYATKAEVDASYKRLLERALTARWAHAVRIGLASHNLFDLAWGLEQATAAGARERIDVEMLEGMAPAQARAVMALAGGLLMYAPVVTDADFEASLAYLTRRLDENTQPDNFLRALFDLTPTSAEFASQAGRFRAAVAERATVGTGRRRAPLPPPADDAFANEPDGDATDPVYRAAVMKALAEPPRVVVPRTDAIEGIELAVSAAVHAFTPAANHNERRRWLHAMAKRMADDRATTVALMAHTVGKTVREGDPEVSEAIDFCRYYAAQA